MQSFKYIFFVPILFLIVACYQQLPPTPEPKIIYIERDYEGRVDEDRDTVLTSSKGRYKGAICEGDKSCEDKCGDIYSTRKYEQKCQEYSIKQVTVLEEIHDALRKPDADDLKKINVRDLDLYVNISIQPLDRYISKYSSGNVKEFLSWLAEDEAAIEIIKKEDDDYKIFEKLFKEIASDPFDGIKKSLSSGETFMDISVVAKNTEALDWIHEYLSEEECNDNPDTKECLKKYCEIAYSMDDDNAQGLLDFKYFNKYIENIIDEKINDERWSSGDFEEVGDLRDWWEDLC